MTSLNNRSPIIDSAAKRAVAVSTLIALCAFYVLSFAFFWSASRNFLERAEPALEPNDTMVMGSEVAIGRGGCSSCRISGWSTPVEGLTWTRAETAALAFLTPELPAIGQRVAVLVIDAAAFLPQGGERVLHVEVDGIPVGDEIFSALDPRNAAFFRGDSYLHSFPLPSRLLAGQRMLSIKFRMVSAGPPRRYRWSADRRELGVAVRSVALHYVDRNGVMQ